MRADSSSRPAHAITTHDSHPPEECGLVDAGLGEFNEQAAPLHEVRPLSCFARSPSGQVLGGAVGRRWGACCELQQLWVDPAHRRKGMGAQLVQAFEDRARAHGCSSFYLETFSFQAPGLYISLGYKVAYEYAGYPHGIVKYHMVKQAGSGAFAAPMPVPAHLSAFWNEFARATGVADENRFYEAFFFGDSEEMANELAGLVLKGTKRATASALWSYEAEGKRLPHPGDLSIVTDGSGRPLCVIETRSVETVPFREVTAEFAAIEGEGDGSLAFWQRAHRDFFSRECAAARREFSESMLVVCECFAVLYRPSASTA